MTYVKPTEIIEKGESTTTMLFPSKVILNLGGKYVEFEPGVHEVPDRLADVKDLEGKSTGLHWYLKAHGVKPYTRPQWPPAKPFEATEDHLKFVQELEVPGVNTVEDVAKFVGSLAKDQKESFVADFKAWQEKPAPEGSGRKGPSKPVDLASMKKAELAVHAKEVHGLELDPSTETKDDMITAIREAAAKKEEE